MKTSHILLGVGAAVAAVVIYQRIAPKKAGPTPTDQVLGGFFAGAVEGVKSGVATLKEQITNVVTPSAPTPTSSVAATTSNTIGTARRVAPLGSYDIGAPTYATNFAFQGLGAAGA